MSTCPAPQVLEGKASTAQLIRNWIVSFTGNFLGSIGVVGLVSLSGLISITAGPAKMAAAKTSLSFLQVEFLCSCKLHYKKTSLPICCDCLIMACCLFLVYAGGLGGIALICYK